MTAVELLTADEAAVLLQNARQEARPVIRWHTHAPVSEVAALRAEIAALRREMAFRGKEEK